jgi:uncharacterized repeat protein (TIGR03803 family)
MTLSGSLTTLLHFANTNGARPGGALIQYTNGDLYGTTSSGGSNGYGTVFRMNLSGALTPLLHFDNTNGANPYAGLVKARDGNLYGTTSSGGSAGYGTAFKMSPSGSLTTLVNFAYTNGATPMASLVESTDGYLYGTAKEGGTGGGGTIFRLGICPRIDGIDILSDQNVQLRLNAGYNEFCSVETSTNFLNWMVLTNLSGSDGSISFVDATATNFPQRFYRAVPNP